MSKDKNRYWDCLDQAMEASHGGRTEEALAWLDEALRAHPGGAEAHNGRGEILWDAGRADEALQEFERAIAADPKFSAAHLNRAELLIEDLGEFELALQECDGLLAGREQFPRPDPGFQSEIYQLKAKALFYLDDLDGALFLSRRAIKTGGDSVGYRAFEGQILFELGRYPEARRALEHSLALDPDSPHSLFHLSLVLERLGEEEAAVAALTRAHAIDPDHYALPQHLDTGEFERAIGEAMANLPRSIREYVQAVPVLVEDFPSTEMVQGENISPQILGIFIGTPRTQASPSEQMPDLDRVIIFKKNLEKVCRSRDDLIEQIQITLRHEIGHYLGLDEDDMERLGLA